jgi:pyruvate,water dikinase
MFLRALLRSWQSWFSSPKRSALGKYETFREVLRHDRAAHELLAEFEGIYYGKRHEEFFRLIRRYDQLARVVGEMIESLCRLVPGAHERLRISFQRLDSQVKAFFAPPAASVTPPYLLPLHTITTDTVEVGHKTRALAQLATRLHLPVPDGFAITVNAFHHFLAENGLRERIDKLLAELDIESLDNLQAVSGRLTALIVAAPVPVDLAAEIVESFAKLSARRGRPVSVAVRSSALSEDEATSFAGQYRSVLHVGQEEILRAYKEVLASKYAPEALYYRSCHGLSDVETAMSVLVLEMIEAEASGVMYTDTVCDSGDPGRKELSLHVVRGQGETLVSGAMAPEVFRISREGTPVVIRQGGASLLDEQQALQLFRWGLRLEEYFGSPQDVEWSLDREGHFHVLQSRPLGRRQAALVPGPVMAEEISAPVLLAGGEQAAGGIACGVVYTLGPDTPLTAMPGGAVLVVRDTPPAYVKVLGRLAAVVAEQGSQACHFATVAREFGVPVLVRIPGATSSLVAGMEVTVDADNGKIYAGRVTALLAERAAGVGSGAPFCLKRLEPVMERVSFLNLLDPRARGFKPESCRSLHDIVRYAHEKAMQEMFVLSGHGLSRRGGARQLKSDLPFELFVLDIGGGLHPDAAEKKRVSPEELRCLPLKALWRGLSHPGVVWDGRQHFDWQGYEAIVMGGGIAGPNSAALASYAVIGEDYLNINIRFGYHFTIVDAFCGGTPAENYCGLRFVGGGGEYTGRLLRVAFLARILERLGFVVERAADLLDARLIGLAEDALLEKLDLVGRLLGATRLLDMVLKDEEMVVRLADDFLARRYDFRKQHSNGKQKPGISP